MSDSTALVCMFVGCDGHGVPEVPGRTATLLASVGSLCLVGTALTFALRLHESSRLEHPHHPGRHLLALVLGGSLGTVVGLMMVAAVCGMIHAIRKTLRARSSRSE